MTCADPGSRPPSTSGAIPRIDLVELTLTGLEALARADLDTASRVAGVRLTPFFVEEAGLALWRRRVAQIAEDPASEAWVARAVVDGVSGSVVGYAGFHGPPDESGMVEVGYSTDPACRRRGYARAALLALIAQAAQEPTVQVVRATISPANLASAALVRQLGFVENGEQWDDEDGLEIIYEVPVPRP